MKKIILFASIVAVSSLVAADGSTLYKKCMGCHGAKGEKTQFVKIQGLSKEDVIAKLKNYQAGKGGAKKAMMLGQVKTLDENKMTALAEYISSF